MTTNTTNTTNTANRVAPATPAASRIEAARIAALAAYEGDAKRISYAACAGAFRDAATLNNHAKKAEISLREFEEREHRGICRGRIAAGRATDPQTWAYGAYGHFDWRDRARRAKEDLEAFQFILAESREKWTGDLPLFTEWERLREELDARQAAASAAYNAALAAREDVEAEWRAANPPPA